MYVSQKVEYFCLFPVGILKTEHLIYLSDTERPARHERQWPKQRYESDDSHFFNSLGYFYLKQVAHFKLWINCGILELNTLEFNPLNELIIQ